MRQKLHYVLFQQQYNGNVIRCGKHMFNGIINHNVVVEFNIINLYSKFIIIF